ncbi:MAG TPA: hypothetical protein VLI04_14860 [Nocardioidaceae bacterium]|nr:hypothetical protein [Nocardioidaceae bacterium]
MMIENETAFRVHKAVLIKRTHKTYEGLNQSDQLSTLLASWRMSLEKAQGLDYLMMVKNGVIVDVATVYGAERIPARHYPEEPRTDEVRLIAGAQAPKIEHLIGTDVRNNFRNPINYVDIKEHTKTGVTSLVLPEPTVIDPND